MDLLDERRLAFGLNAKTDGVISHHQQVDLEPRMNTNERQPLAKVLLFLEAAMGRPEKSPLFSETRRFTA